jgi:hypothetical protein
MPDSIESGWPNKGFLAGIEWATLPEHLRRFWLVRSAFRIFKIFFHNFLLECELIFASQLEPQDRVAVCPTPLWKAGPQLERSVFTYEVNKQTEALAFQRGNVDVLPLLRKGALCGRPLPCTY